MNRAIPQMCTHQCSANCYKDTCPRGSWHTPVFQTAAPSKVGSDTECPLMQFPLKNRSKAKRRNLTVGDTWNICAECKFAAIIQDEDYPDCFEVNISASIKDHCVDCPVYQTRERIQENMAEAAIS